MGGLARPARTRGARLSVAWIERLDEASPAAGALVWTPSAQAAADALASTPACPEDVAHAARRRDPERRARTLARRRLLRALAARALGAPSEAVSFVQAAAGGPAVAAPRPLHASLAARGDHIVLAVAERPIGVDVELCEPSAHRPLDLLHPRLADRLRHADAAAFTQAWSGAEAYLKMLGVGLDGLARMDVEGDRAVWVDGCRPTARLERRWRGDAVHTVAVPV